ncbi:DUF6915 family protein [Palleronia caenipelagi]|uniref:DUF6915 domain-containing protein n=1 Tax=Palleronia caenipelagi TaxID=2489174 RepID=A0A547PT36_9RHOB|nr:hypothetical protein [Palleronia caenipelagi]TRD17305.1 hypothetical protein FEV53_13310 [Palleronia caenipelagi]
MAHPFHHAESSARKYGGDPSDYLAVHSWFDASKAHLALFTHRAVRHNTFGVFEAERIFGATLTNSDGRKIPTRFIGEQHVKEDCQGRIPSLADWLGRIRPEPWMANGHIDLKPDPLWQDPRDVWVNEVATGRTILGLQDWIAARNQTG